MLEYLSTATLKLFCTVLPSVIAQRLAKLKLFTLGYLAVDARVFDAVVDRHKKPYKNPKADRDDAQQQVQDVAGFVFLAQKNLHLLIRVGHGIALGGA